MKPTNTNALFFYARPKTSNFSGKTRIGSAIGNQPWANDLAKALITDMHTEYAQFGSSYDLYTPEDFPHLDFEQVDTGMHKMFQTLLQTYERVIIVGSDIPWVTQQIIEASFSLLDTHDATIIPTIDKGYGLIGMRTYVDLFTDISQWKSRASDYNLATETIALAEKKGKSLRVQEEVFDIDEVEDISLLAEHIDEYPHMRNVDAFLEKQPIPFKVSIVIPTYNEEANIAQVVSAHTHAGIEIIVADGGSTDATVSLATNAGATIITSDGGRGGSLRAGAKAASNDLLLFLHADTVLPKGWLKAIQHAITEGAVGGAFKLSFNNSHWFYTGGAAYANMRARVCSAYHGDQAMFILRSVYESIGGFPDVPIMEDVMLSKKMKKAGKTNQVPLSVISSDRRIKNYGRIKSTFRYFLMKSLFYFGASPSLLTKIYR
ncbi:MAG: DUF2064 domain-containing protein [Candidatus Magasanikbacteria bacterium]|mgnify:CR=1 FL=1|jgi:uncharacterized protein|nr:DUF2064 domain-containing protein [Candidatus Magasanikbacteria bacterium]